MDLDGDGILDVTSGRYDPGVVSFFKGTKAGFERGVLIREAHVTDAVTGLAARPGSATSDEQDMDTMMATANWADWDGDGDLDMVVGSIKGCIYVNRNTGTKTAYAFGAREPVLGSDGKPLRVVQKSDPLPCDWDGDGVLDLLVGDEAGDVTFFRGRKDRRFERGVSIVTGDDADANAEYTVVRERVKARQPFPGWRLRLAVTDWNEDGKLDLLIGDCEEGKGPDGKRKTTGFVYLLLRE